MAQINLKDFYPSEKKDIFVDVSDELAAVMFEFRRREANYEKRLRRHKAYYSLDRSDGVENSIIFQEKAPDELYEEKVANEELHTAIAQLSKKQAQRIVAYFLLGISKEEIARAEGVSWFSINKSIRQGLIRIEKILRSSSEQYQ